MTDFVEVIVTGQTPIEVAGPQGPPGTNAQQYTTTNVPDGTTTVLYSVPTTTCRTIKWIVEIEEPGGGLFRSMEVLAVQALGGLRYTIYGRVGDGIDVQISARVVGPDIELVATNNEGSDVTVRVLIHLVCPFS